MNITLTDNWITSPNMYALIVLAMFVYVCVGVVRYLEHKSRIETYNVTMNCNIKRDDVLKELDDFIQSKWDEYFIFNLGWQEKYIPNSKEQEKIIHELGTEISKSISPVLIDKLARFYNRDVDENGVSAIDTLIASKIHMLVLNYGISELS